MNTYLVILIGSLLVNNYVMNQFLGICPFLGVSKKMSTAAGMGAAVTFVLTLATIVTYLLQKFVLNAFDIQYMQTILFILVIASLVQMVEIILKKISPSLYSALGVFLPLITPNCCILGVAITVGNGVASGDYDLIKGVIYAIATAIGYALALILFSALREHLELMDVPQSMKGTPIALITAGLMAMAFVGFSGLC